MARTDRDRELLAQFEQGDLSPIVAAVPQHGPMLTETPAPLPLGVPTTQISLRLPTDLLGHFDAIAEQADTSRSDLVRHAMVQYLRQLAAARQTRPERAEVEHALAILRDAALGSQAA